MTVFSTRSNLTEECWVNIFTQGGFPYPERLSLYSSTVSGVKKRKKWGMKKLKNREYCGRFVFILFLSNLQKNNQPSCNYFLTMLTQLLRRVVPRSQTLFLNVPCFTFTIQYQSNKKEKCHIFLNFG